ncbi:16S rRNA processing protein RimM [Solimonas aquatica]|uniref:Ribosome maturation factor RimM n=1 Tax=Solimonas aquatica TaxID=489703 RepID=A0A1H9HA97_9GAMM|nr:ribosome maturation factor RimM [Solimonas aquatica]SEQ59158.1 16S rRNA processing protein RimM [Solimonas aquatica]
MQARRVTLGRVAGVYGVQGWIRVYSYTDPPHNILKYKRWWLSHGEGYETEVLDGRQHGLPVVAQLSNAKGEAITDRDQAALLIGAEIQVEREALPKLRKDQFYWIDLIGLSVENTEGQALGQVRDVTSNGAQDVLVVAGEGERLIPFVRPQIIKSVDLAEKRIVCDWQLDW